MPTNDDKRLIPTERAPGGDPLLTPAVQDRGRGYGYGSGYGYSGQREQASGFNIRDFFRIVRKNLWIIVTLVVVVTTLVAVAAFKVENRYSATATVVIQSPGQNLAIREGIVITNPSDSYAYYKTQLRLLKMPDLVRRVVVELDLEHNPNFFSPKPASLNAALVSLVQPGRTAPRPMVTPGDPTPPPDLSKPLDDATIQRLAPYVATVAGGLDIQEVPGTQLVNISFQHHDPEIASKVANSIAENFVKENLNQRINSKSTTSDFLQKRVAELQAQVRAGEERLLNYGRSHEILSVNDAPGDQNAKSPAVERLSDLNEQLVKAEADVQSFEATREAMKQTGDADVMRTPMAQKDVGAQELSRQISELRQRRTELLQRYTEEYPEVKTIDERLAELDNDMAKVKARIATQADTEYQAAVIKEKRLRQEVEAQKGQMMQQNEAAISYRIIQQEVDTNKNFLNTLLGRLKEVDLSAASEVNNVVLTDRAIGAGRIGPDRSQWILLSFLVSLFGGIGLAFAREYLDQTIKSLEDIDRVIQLPSLGIIPALSAGAVKGPRRRLAAKNGVEPAPSTELISALNAKSAAAEAYRQLRTSVLLSSAGHPSKLLLVTSSQPREGKTTTAVNTAISLAQTGARTVIVDCDMRRPRVHQLLNVGNEIGGSLYLSGQREDIEQLIQESSVPNLSVMPCGPIPPNPAELLGSEQMRKMLAELSKLYDHVVVDTPPVISFADPVILSTMVDGVILVVRGGFSSRAIVLRSRQLLSDVGAKIYGVVLNDADVKATEYYGSYYYNHYYSKNDDEPQLSA